MARPRRFDLLVASDGSPNAQAAVRLAAAFPWPAPTRAHGVVAPTGALGAEPPGALSVALDQGLRRVGEATRRVLGRRWPDADVAVVPKSPAEAILGQARRLGAGAIVVGSRGHGAVTRFLLGSVSRDVMRRATCPTLVAKGRPRPVRHLVLGHDGSPNASRAVDFTAGLDAPRGGRVTLVRVVPLERMSGRHPLSPAAMAIVRSRMEAVNAERVRQARRELAAAARALGRSGWKVRTVVRTGAPLDELLAAVRAARAQVLVVGARGAGGMKKLLLGSVAEGALNLSPVSVLVVR